jgi:hypothetical protein
MTSYNKPDLNAPRYRAKRYNILNAEFCNKIREKKEEYKNLTDKQIKEVVKTFNENLWKTVIEKRDGLELLEQLGYVFIGTCQKKKRQNTDVKSSLKYGVKVQHQNWESDQLLAKIFYTNFETKYRFKFHEVWGFTALRDFKRTVSKTYPTEWKKYVVVDNMARVSRLFRKQVFTDKKDKETELLMESYDEFDMT